MKKIHEMITDTSQERISERIVWQIAKEILVEMTNIP